MTDATVTVTTTTIQVILPSSDEHLFPASDIMERLSGSLADTSDSDLLAAVKAHLADVPASDMSGLVVAHRGQNIVISEKFTYGKRHGS